MTKLSLRPLYDWVVKQAAKRHAPYLLFLVALIEPCMLPLPPDALLIPMIIAKRKRAFKLAVICTAGSIIGSFIGYGIGALAIATVGKWLITTYNHQDAFEHFRYSFHKWGMLVIIVKGSIPVIPVPFFLVTLASGFVHFDIPEFLFAVTLARGSRFAVEAALLHRYGEPIRVFIERYLSWVAAAIIAGVAIWVYFVVR